MSISEILEISFFGNTFAQYLFFITVFLVLMAIAFVFKKYLLRILKKMALKTKTEYDDALIEMINSIKFPFYAIIAFYFSIQVLETPKIIQDASYYLLLIGALYYAVRALQNLIDFFVKEYEKQRAKNGEDVSNQPKAMHYLAIFAKLILWLFAALIFLANIGVEITPLIAGLGIGGIAIALALQHILQDVLNFFAIYFDKPFAEGDFLIIGEEMGVVEKIGIRSTRLKSLRGEELIISNQELTSSKIHNFKKMDYRRVQFGFGVAYETPTKKIEKIPQIVKKIIENQEKTRVDRIHFKEFGDYALKFETVYFLDSNNYNEYMDTQQKINLGIKKELEKIGVEFAYLTYKILK
ncbi:MAG: mechanosensitive ion channel family protein [Candidatus ainarchaeum sp.]|nr:mechanosensitive ion channel family protein [Candidatus ainarchaeum sp.]